MTRVRARHFLCAAAAMVAATPATAAHAAPATPCKSADLRYPFQPGGPKTFGVFKLRITDGTCSTAHRIAKEWMNTFEGDLLRGHLRLPKQVFGFEFRTLEPTAAQTFNERGRKGATTIRFDYRVPNG